MCASVTWGLLCKNKKTGNEFIIFSKHTLNPTTQPVAVKLDDGNFLLWQQQVLAVIEGLGLDRSTTGTCQCPQEFLTTTTWDGQASDITKNPEHVAWKRQDELIISWILGSVTKRLLPQLVGCTTFLHKLGLE
ncbi:Retrotran gag 3 domain-containing protein [Abeliophyllum distichum]|uniref:Retrotran gag 3 domain-containing protein n=1 Tax=Abeliophyllum distichum TaxID=126358 RepID=A0ABD1TXI4_9LAMI